MFLVGIIAAHLLLLLNLKFTAWPEMLLWPYLWIHNLLPYKDVAIVHTPLLVAKLAIFYKLFGVGILQLKVFTWALIVFSDLLVYWVTKKLWNRKTALAAVAIFAFWQIFFDGNGLWFDLMLAPLSLITFYLLQQKKYFWTGVLWATMFLTKQTAVWFLIPVGFYSIKDLRLKIQDFRNLVIGVLSVLIPFIIILWVFGILPDFYKWAINFGVFILPKASGQIQLPDLKNLIVTAFPFLMFVPLILKSKFKNLSLLVWSVAGVLGAYPRFEYFHFQPGLPFLAIASGIVLTNLVSKDNLIKVFIIFYAVGSLYLFASFFIRNWGEGTRFFETDVLEVAAYVKNNSKPDDAIFVMNWWDNIYPLTGTLPGTIPWVPQLSWYQEVPGIQEKEVADLKSSKPKLILLQEYSETGLASYKPQKIYDYVMVNYKISNKVDGVEILVRK
jgi:4-amino-4-deoxy-L-arabinose transferase-like glycosyltransferase